MVVSAGFTAAVTAAIARELEGLGFAKRRGGILTLPLADGVLGWIGLNTATHRPDGVLAINPVIGVRHQAVEALVAKLHGEKAHAYEPPTVSIALGYLMPGKQFRQWFFGSEADLESGCRELVTAVERYALPFLADHRTLAAVTELLEQGLVPAPEQRAERAIAAAMLAGDPDRARQEMAAIMDRVGDRTDAAAVRIKAFVAAAQAA